LHARLARRGLTLSAVLGAVEVSRGTLAAGSVAVLRVVPAFAGEQGTAAARVSSRVAALAEGGLKGMAAVRGIGLALLLAVATAAAGAGLLARQTTAAVQTEARPAQKRQPEGDRQLASTDRYDNPLPPGALARLGTIRLRHGDGIHSVAFLPDGKSFVSAAGSFDPTIRVWDAATGRELRRIQVYPGFPLVQGSVMAVAVSPDGKLLASDSAGMPNHVHIWEADTGRRLHVCVGHREGVCSVAFSPDGKAVASAGYDKTVRLWNANTGEELRLLEGHREAVCCVRFSPDGTTLASGSEDQTIRLWDAASGKEIRVLTGHEGSVLSIAFDGNGKTIASGGKDKTIRLWDSETGREIRRMAGLASDVKAVAFLPDGRGLVSAGRTGGVCFWDHSGLGCDHGARAATEEKPRQRAGSGFNALSLSSDGKFAVSAGQDHAVRIWEVATGQEVLAFREPQGEAYGVAFAPDGRPVASGGRDSSILVWDATGQGGAARPAAIGPDAKELEALWADLTGTDAARAYRAMWSLAEAPTGSLPLFRERLRPAHAVDVEQLARVIAALDSDRFEVREKASAYLQEVAAAAESALRKRLEDRHSPEARRRIEQALEAVGGEEQLRMLRALATLERIGAPAVSQLQTLARGAPGARLTQEAKASLQRLARRSPASP
jgi:WD40 repeat protein